MLESKSHTLQGIDCNGISSKTHMAIHSDNSSDPIYIRLEAAVRTDVFSCKLEKIETN